MWSVNVLPVAVWEYSSFLSQLEDMHAELTGDSNLGKILPLYLNREQCSV